MSDTAMFRHLRQPPPIQVRFFITVIAAPVASFLSSRLQQLPFPTRGRR